MAMFFFIAHEKGFNFMRNPKLAYIRFLIVFGDTFYMSCDTSFNQSPCYPTLQKPVQYCYETASNYWIKLLHKLHTATYREALVQYSGKLRDYLRTQLLGNTAQYCYETASIIIF